MRTPTVAAALSAVAIVLSSQTAFSTTLPEAVVKSLESHPEVQMAKERKNAIEQEFRQAKAGFLPTVDLTAGTGIERSDNATTRNRADRNGGEGYLDLWRNESRLTASQMLFDGFETDAESCQQRERFISAMHNVTEITETTALRSIEAYLNVLKHQQLVDLAENNLRTHETYLDQIKKRSSSGRGSDADVRQAQSRVALIRSNLLTAEGDLRNAQASYLEVVGEAPQNLKRSSAPLKDMPQNLADALARAMDNNPALKSGQHDINAVDEAVRATKSAFYPRFDLELVASQNHNLDGSRGDNDEYSAMVRMSYNLYRGGADVARKNEQVARREEARDTLERDRRLVEETVYKAWNNYQTAKNRLAPLSLHVTTSNQTRAAYKSQFEIGKRSLLDLLDSEVEFFEAKSAYIAGLYATDFAVYEILAATGDLVNTLTIPAGEAVETVPSVVETSTPAVDEVTISKAAEKNNG